MTDSKNLHSWSDLSQYFDADKDEIEAGAADNILIAWPVVLEIISKSAKLNGNAIDLGCGAGTFARKLHELGYNVTGIDPAVGMIKVASKFKSDNLAFICGTDQILTKLPKSDVVTSIMAFQFIRDIETTIKNIEANLVDDGIVVFAVFNAKYVESHINNQTGLFEGFNFSKKSSKGSIKLGDNTIDTFSRTASVYDDLFIPLGFQKVAQEYPPFTKEFLEKYPINDITEEPEYLILGYRKAN